MLLTLDLYSHLFPGDADVHLRLATATRDLLN
jgi:hypothetical protein